MSGVMSAIGLSTAADAAAAAGTDALAAGATDIAGTAGADALGTGLASSIPAGVLAGAPVYGSEAAAAAANAGMGLGGLGGALTGMNAGDAMGGGGLSGLFNSLGSGISSGLNSVGSGIDSLFGSGVPGDAGVNPGIGQAFNAEGDSVAMDSPDAVSFGSSSAGTIPSGSGGGSTASSGGSGIMSSIQKNPLGYAGAANIGLATMQSLLNPLPKYNVAGTANSVMATNPSFNAALPKYTMQNTATPYSGNWYQYGQSPQAPMYNAMPVPAAKHGGLMKYAHGGQVRGYAVGGMPISAPMPQNAPPPMVPPQGQMPPQGMPTQVNPLQMAPAHPPVPPQGMPQGALQRPSQKPVNPLALKAVHEIGVAIGKHLKSKMRTPDGQVNGAGGGQDDAIPARLSQDEYIVPADVTAALGDGSSNEGGKKLDQMVHKVRAHKVSKGAGFPPKAHNPLSYIPKKVKV